MLDPPFSRQPDMSLPPFAAAVFQDELLETFAPPSLPTVIRNGNTITRTIDEPDRAYMKEITTERLDSLVSHLWLAGLPNCARPLHRQQLLGREIVITEDPNEHLIWHEKRIFIKPLPLFLVDIKCWTEVVCKNVELHKAACGLLLSYAWIIRHPSDLRIAHEKGLLPASMDWKVWTDLVNDFLSHIDLQSLSAVSPRYQYGELRLSRLNKICYIWRFTWRHICWGYIPIPTWYSEFFTRNFTWLLAVFAVVSVALSAMQVGLSTTYSGGSFNKASYGFTVASLFAILVAAVALFMVWISLFVYHLLSTRINNERVMRTRRNAAANQRGNDA